MLKRSEESDKPEVPLMIRLPRDLHAAVRAAADKDERSLNSWVIRALRAQLEKKRSR